MKGSVKVIKFTVVMSIVFLILTYFTTVNIEAHILELNTIWLSNNLALTVFGGAFASMLVVLICEVQKYVSAKVSVEEYIFYQALYLYQALFLMQQNISDYQNNTEAIVPDNLLDETTRMIQSEIIALRSVDYAPFRQKNLLLSAHQKFCKETAINMQPIMKGCNAVRITINKIKIDRLQQNTPAGTVTSANELMNAVLSIQSDRVSTALKEVNEYLNNIDKYCKYRYGWEKQQEQIHSNYVNVFEAWNFEKEFQKET
ncbi:MAG: hypothetical protein NC355_07375 [Blautia sp.]|nr:hypothetical protein [Blautia sp.]